MAAEAYRDPWDDQGHGTHVSGTIGAKGNNFVGTAGVNWQVQLLAAKFLDAEGSGSSYGSFRAVEYAINQGAHVLSNSWGGGDFSQALFDLIAEADERGVIFVAASGNDSKNNDHIHVRPPIQYTRFQSRYHLFIGLFLRRR